MSQRVYIRASSEMGSFSFSGEDPHTHMAIDHNMSCEAYHAVTTQYTSILNFQIPRDR